MTRARAIGLLIHRLQRHMDWLGRPHAVVGSQGDARQHEALCYQRCMQSLCKKKSPRRRSPIVTHACTSHSAIAVLVRRYLRLSAQSEKSRSEILALCYVYLYLQRSQNIETSPNCCSWTSRTTYRVSKHLECVAWRYSVFIKFPRANTCHCCNRPMSEVLRMTL